MQVHGCRPRRGTSSHATRAPVRPLIEHSRVGAAYGLTTLRVPVHNPQGAQRVPAAGVALAVVHLDVLADGGAQRHDPAVDARST